MRLEKAILIAMSLFILLCGPFFSLVPLDGGGMSIKDQPMAYTTIDSDYNVYSGEIKGIDSEQWIMNANIQINPGGTLYINSTDLLWGGTTDGQFGLYVDYGGKLIIDQKCNFSANDTTTHITGTTTVWDETWGIHWKFEIFGEAYIANSTLSYMWGANGNYLQDARGGIQCFSDDIMIYNVDIYNVEQCGISAVDKSGSSTSGFDPVIENVRISNTTGWGIFAGGSSGNPSVTNVTIKDSDYRGVQYFYGAYGKFENVTIDNCVDLAMTYDPITGGTLNLRNCTFTRSLYGYAARRGGTVNLFDCDLNNNIEYGLQLAHDTGYTQVVNMYGGNIKHNGKDGIGTTYVTGSGTISDVEIAYNGLNGTYIGPGLTMSIESCKIYENGEYGFVSNGSAGSLIGNRIYDNVLGNVLLYNGATTSVSNNVINSSVMGVDLLDSSPTITGNTISDNNVGLNVPAGNEPTVVSNKFNNNVRGGVVTEITGGDIEGNNFTGNAYAGLMLIDCMDLSVKESGFDGNNIGIEIIGGNFIDIKNVKIENSVDSGIFCHSGANISITNPSPKSTSITADPNTRALYYMNEGAGMITQDATANGNDGSLVNSPVWSQGKWGGALNFNGLDQYVAVADSPSLAISGNTLSIEAWIRVDQGSLGSTRMILNKEESYKVALNSDRYIMWAIMTTTTDWTWTTTDARVPIGAWSFIALTYDGSTVKTYVDGQIKDTDSYANGNVADSSEIMCIGAGYNAGVGGFGEYFLGSIDEVRISDIARSPLEIQAIYNTPSDLTQIDTVKLNGGSGVWAYSVPIPINAVTIMDSYSFFKKFLTFTVLVLDNVTGLPVDSAELQIFNNDDETIFLESTNQFGLVQKATILQYTMEGATIVDNNPMNISISKDGYVPWWTEEKQVKNLDFEMIIEISENRAPEFPPILNVTPVTTHLKRPAVSWNGAKDWNSDIVTYEINVYMDELYGTEIFDQPLITRATQFQFEKNLRFNREYWVEIMASDPWGMSDTVTFSFRTVNNQPTTPEVIFLEDSVSSNDDIVISIANHTTDIDIDPIDDLSYMVEWYKVGEDADILLMSGINLTTLPSEETNEGDEIKVYIKPYDGIEYGIKAILYIEVVNFVPENIIPYVDVEIDEDTTGFDMVDLNELFTDRDNDNLFFSVDVERHISVEIDPVSGNVSFIPDENWNGVDYIIIQARDTKYHDEEWPTVTINVTVNSVNDAPEFILVNDEPVSIGEMILIQDIQGAPLTITSTAIDADEVYGDKFDFSTNFLEVVEEGIIGEDDLQFLDSTGSMSIYLSNDLVGEHIFNLTVTDEGGASSDVTIRLIVDNKNDPPTPPAFKDLVANQKLTQGKDEKTVFSITPSDDPDIYIPNSKENLIYNWEFGDGEVLENGGLEVSHKYATSGNYTVTVTVLDKAGESETIDITIRVDVYQSIIVRPVIEDDTVDKQIVFIIILVLVVIIALIAILVFIFRKDPLSDVAEAEEQAHEVLVAKQQEDALAAHEQLQALMGSMGYAEAAGPALPSAPMEGQMEALPAPSEPIPEQGYEQPPMEQQPYPEQPAPAYEQPPMEQQPYYPEQPAPAYEQPPMQAAPQQPPMEPIPAPEQPLMQAAPQQPPMEPIPAPEQPPMQPAPAGTVPTPEQPQAQTNLPAPEEQQ